MFCSVLKDDDNKASTINVEELLESAKALYSRQQHFVVREDSLANGETSHFRYNLSLPAALDQFGVDLSSSPPNNGYHMYGYVEGYLPPASFHSMFTPTRRGMGGDGGRDDASTPNSSFQTSFTSTAVNTTPRKGGKGSNFRNGKGGGSGGGRGGSKNHHHHLHHHHSNSDTAIFNHNHNNNHNSSSSSSSTPTSSNSSSNGSNGNSGDRFHWVRGGKGHNGNSQQQNGNAKDSK
jgi:hypothetical protein